VTAPEAAAAHAELSRETTRTRVLRWQDPMALAAAGAKMDGLSYVRAIAAGDLPPPPIAVLLNFSVVEIEAGRAVFEGEPREEHYNPIGVVHGGYAATILDSALGCAVHTTLPAGVGYTTLGLEVKFVRPIGDGIERVRAAAEVVHRGRRQATAEARLTDVGTEKLLAHATTTCLIV
jgi:uncharacterized protein (TIGR00369 family)